MSPFFIYDMSSKKKRRKKGKKGNHCRRDLKTRLFNRAFSWAKKKKKKNLRHSNINLFKTGSAYFKDYRNLALFSFSSSALSSLLSLRIPCSPPHDVWTSGRGMRRTTPRHYRCE